MAQPQQQQPAPEPKRFAINHDEASPLIRRTAEAMYLAYVGNSGNLTYDGKQCPTWDKLGEPVRSHWCAAARRALQVANAMHPSELDLESRA